MGYRMKELEIDDYVLATKWGDGDPQDQWCVGFYNGKLRYEIPRYSVIDNEGKEFRHNGFRRVKKISVERGKWILEHINEIQQSNKSLWWWVRQSMKN